MARKGRIEFSGAVYHVLDRGNRHLGHVSRLSRCWEQGNGLVEELEGALKAK